MSVLHTITQKRRAAIEALATQPHFSQARLEQHIREHARPVRSLARALRQADKGFILECKKASPSKGLLRENFDPVAIARVYQGYAAAVSVLTEPDYFAGDFAYLQAVSQQVQVPVLCKDFIVEPLQVYLARYYGADAILLMLAILSDDEYRVLAELAAKLGLEVLTEVCNPAEMQRAAHLDAAVIGINHRNLHDLSINLNRSQELAALAPPQALLVAASGIENNQQVRRIAQHVDGFLVGGHLTAHPDIDLACRQLIYGQHKVCGLTRAEDAHAAAAAGATYGGLIFAPTSPRSISAAEAANICTQVPALRYVAVITGEDLPATFNVATKLPLHAIQLHSQQSAEFVNRLRAQLDPEIAIWYALDMSLIASAEALTAELTALFGETAISKVVLDQGRGGSGRPFDWSLLNALPAELLQRCVLAGGLQAGNIAAAAALGCAGLDINSGVESAPGLKDSALLQQCFSTMASYYRKHHPVTTTKTATNTFTGSLQKTEKEVVS